MQRVLPMLPVSIPPENATNSLTVEDSFQERIQECKMYLTS